MSKRESSTMLERPIEPIPATSCKGGVVTLDAITQPVEPVYTVVSIPFDQISPETILNAPIHAYLRSQFDGKYSHQCIVRRLIEMIDQESWHALCGVPQFRAIHSANVVLIEQLLALLDGRDAQEESAAA